MVDTIGELGDRAGEADPGRDDRQGHDRQRLSGAPLRSPRDVQDRDRRPRAGLRAAGPGDGRTGSRTLRGDWVILAFYPGDFTPVCTRQFCSYRDAADHLDDLDAEVLGISPQSVSSHERFVTEHGLTVPLLADPDHATARAYGVVAPGGLVRRSIFIVDPEGTVRYRHVGSARPALQGRRAPRRRAVARPRRRRGPVSAEAAAFSVEREGAALRGEAAGDGHPIALLHGLTATRRYVVHGSRALARSGFRTLAYDARGHGESDPAPHGHGLRLRRARRRPRRGARRRGRRSRATCSPGTRWARTRSRPTRSPTRSAPRRSSSSVRSTSARQATAETLALLGPAGRRARARGRGGLPRRLRP